MVEAVYQRVILHHGGLTSIDTFDRYVKAQKG